MSKIANITMAAAIAASAVIGGAVSAYASNSYGPDAAPYPSSMKTPAPKTSLSEMMRPDHTRTGSVSGGEKAKDATVKHRNAR